MTYDLIIIGMGPAGVSAAIYAKRAGLKILCFESKMIGGTLNFIDKIDNYPGLYNVSGPDFAYQLYQSLKELDIEVINKKITHIVDGKVKEVYVDDTKYLCKNIIIATGRSPKKLGLPNEEQLLGNGISHCALCDGAFYKNKDIAVVGGGNSAIGEALYLSNICNKVYLIHRRDTFRAEKVTLEKLSAKENVTTITNVNVKELKSENGRLKSIILDNEQELEISGLFTYIGFIPNTDFLASLDIIDESGYIETDNHFETKRKGMYAIGDIVKKEIYQITTAVAEGTIAATSIIEKQK